MSPISMGFMLAAISLWGMWGFFGKLAINKGMYPAAVFIAEAIATFLICLVVLSHFANRHKLHLLVEKANIFGFASGLAMALGLWFFYQALSREDVSVVVPITAGYPVVAALLGVILLGEVLSIIQWLGVVMIVVGIIFLVTF